MPIIKGYYFSRKSLIKDRKFLIESGLSDNQIERVVPYLQRRLRKNTFLVLLVALFLFLAGGIASILVDVAASAIRLGLF